MINIQINKKVFNKKYLPYLDNEDRYLLEILKEELHCTNPIVISNCQLGANHRKPQARFRWTSVPMKTTLEQKYNVHINKTLDIEFKFPFNSIPNKFIGAFIRGFIDGDGSFESHDYVFNPSIVGTSKTFIQQVGDIVCKETGLIYKLYEKQGKTCNYYTLRWSANNSNKFDKIQKLYNLLYKDATICLKRKKDKIIAYLEYRANQLGIKANW